MRTYEGQDEMSGVLRCEVREVRYRYARGWEGVVVRDVEQEQLLALASELNAVRLRGVDAIDRDTARQPRLRIPCFDELVEVSPWSHEVRRHAVRQILRAGVAYISDHRQRSALIVLYDLDAQGLSARERRDRADKLLHVAPHSSEEARKLIYRDARLDYAQAILQARSRFFGGPRFEDLYDAADEQLPSSVLGPLVELRVLAQGHGVSAERVARLAPEIQNLPGTRDQYRRGNVESLPAAAVAFIECAAREPRMHVERSGLLAAWTLNLNGHPLSYPVRRARWIKENWIEDEVEYDDLERRALVRLAVVLSTLQRSPCAVDDVHARARATAEHLFALLLQVSERDHGVAAEHLLYMIEEALPTIGRQGVAFAGDPEWSIAEWFEWALGQFEVFLTVGLDQYRARVNADEDFLPIWVTINFLTEAVTTDEEWWRGRTPFEYLAERNYFKEATVAASAKTGNTDRIWGRDASVVKAALRRSLSLIAQLLAFCEATAFWPTEFDLSYRDADYLPWIPLTSVSELRPAPIELD